jgi:predicted DNA-binding antitoxin AbrB/MazE fold protein
MVLYMTLHLSPFALRTSQRAACQAGWCETSSPRHPEADRQEGVSMGKTIQAIFESGLLRPLEPLNFRESQRVTLTIEAAPSVVDETQALIPAQPEVVKEVAESDEYLPESG